MATTDPQKLPATILSRLTNIRFTKASSEEIERQLARVITGEGWEVENGVIALISRASDGSFRDAVKYLESLSLQGLPITLSRAQEYLFAVDGFTEQFIKALEDRNSASALSLIETISSQGKSMRDFIDSLLWQLRGKLLQGNSQLIPLVDLLLEARQKLSISPIETLPLEILVLKWCGSTQKLVSEQDIDTQKKTEKLEEEIFVEPILPQNLSNLDETAWAKLLLKAREFTTLDALLRACEPTSFDGDRVTIGVYYRFHKERLEDNANKRMMEDVCASVFGKKVGVEFVLVERSKPRQEIEAPLTPVVEKDIIQAAEEIFQ